MKHLTLLAVVLLSINAAICHATGSQESSSGYDKFTDWTEEQFRQYEDSILKTLYAPVIAKKADSSYVKINSGDGNAVPSKLTSSHVPNSVTIDKNRKVGQILINSGTSQTGAKTYDVPINTYPGMNDFTPHLSLAYNSLQGNSVMGIGWSVSGLSMISRCEKNKYYDSKAEGIVMDNSDAFVLDGIRLIKTETTGSYIIYESEFGNIKAKGYINDDVMKFFEVFYPEGIKSVFGLTSDNTNSLYYPLTSMTDLNGNEIIYNYSLSGNHYNIKRISYNGASVEFVYKKRDDPLIYYKGGLKITEDQLLTQITCKLENATLGMYSLQYSTKDDRSFLTSIDYVLSGESYNPLHFYYGQGDVASTYTTSNTHLTEWYVSEDPDMIKVVKGKFDYDSGADGLIVLPNYNPYWKQYEHSTLLWHSKNYFQNQYGGEEKIFLYTGLKDDWVDPIPDLRTGQGFIDILCADLDGKQEESVIKINDYEYNNYDHVIFNIYHKHPIIGYSKAYTRTYDFSTIYKDASGNKSIHPKFYYTGDFNGDGKMEILSISAHQPFGETDRPSKCYIFDLADNRILFQEHIFPFNVDFLGTRQTDAKAAANNTDKIFIIDFDGDGKNDICHINENGTDIYTFDTFGNSLKAHKITTFSGLKKSDVADRELLIGEFNGDGLSDLLVSPKVGNTDWKLYYSKGDGQFESSFFTGSSRDYSDTRFIVHDANSDGIFDLIRYGKYGFSTYLTKNDIPTTMMTFDNLPSSKAVLIPTNIISHNCFTQLASLYEGCVTKYSTNRNDNLGSLLTGMVNSCGVIEKNYYGLIDDEGIVGDFYTRGWDASFPYVNIQEPLSVLKTSDIYINGKEVDHHDYVYYNAVLHRQGLGFRGFEKITTTNKKGQKLIRTYDPYSYCQLKSEEAPTFNRTYSYNINIEKNRIAKIRLTSKTEQDLLRNIKATHVFGYDSYGYPTYEFTSYPGNLTILKNSTYSSETTVGNGYNLGFLTNQTVTVTRDGAKYTERVYTPAFSKRQPSVKIFYKDGNQVRQEVYAYDSHGNQVSETVKPYTSQNGLKTTFEYDSYGRLIKETDITGLSCLYTYDSSGNVATSTNKRGGVTTYSYEIFGREKSRTYPDGTREETIYAWMPDDTDGLYSITRKKTGEPTVTEIYDALNREVRKGDLRFDGNTRYIDKQYDTYGNLLKVSLPYFGDAPSLWNTYTYDDYDRILSRVEASGRETIYSYDGCSVTTIEDNISTTKTYDALDNVVSSTDPTGTITYNLAPDGQPMSVVAPGDIETSFGYDCYRRQTSITDPSAGTKTYGYDEVGNIAMETNANGEVTVNEYDKYNRLKKTTTSELITSYTYNTYDELSTISADNGTAKIFVYDKFGRLSVLDEHGANGTMLQKHYTYSDGNISSVAYISQNGLIGKETYRYENGHMCEASLNGVPLYTLKEENCFGKPTKVFSGCFERTYNYTNYGLPSGRESFGTKLGHQNFSYIFNHKTNCLISRTDKTRNITERFAYDSLNRLTSGGILRMTYDNKGNITNKNDAGTFSYDIIEKPYAISDVTTSGNAIQLLSQEITYNSFSRPATISENGRTAKFTYNGEYDRVRMILTAQDSIALIRHYLGKCYELDSCGTESKEKLYLFGDYYDAPAVLIKDTDGIQIYHILRDYLGSITHIFDKNGALVQELSYDAWGRLRNPVSQIAYGAVAPTEPFLGRGYTGHEHLLYFRLINMNARLYDPALGRFLSPDPFVQLPFMSQNFNRYSYALNNPLCYIDKDGEFWWFIIGAIIGGTANLITKAVSGQLHSFSDGLAAFGIGAVAGCLGGAAGSWAFAAAGGAIYGGGGFLAGACSGALGAATTMSFQSVWNHMYFNDPYMSFKNFVIGVATGAALGGVVNGSIAAANHKNFWTGNKVANGSVFSFKNNPVTSENPSREIKFVDSNNSASNRSSEFQTSQKPLQEHHYISDKNSTYTPEFRKVTDKYGLDLNGSWNKERLPHLGRHPNNYHEWILENIKEINSLPNMNQTEFIKQFNIKIIQPVKANPDILYKHHWINKQQ